MGRGQRAITVHGDSARVHGGAGSGCREGPESEGKWGPGQASVYYQFMVSILAKWVQGSEEDYGLIIQAHVEFGQLHASRTHLYLGEGRDSDGHV